MDAGERRRWSVKIALIVWALLFVVIETVANRLAAAGWRPLQAMDLVAGAVDALPLFAVVLGLALGAGALRRSWRRAARAWEREQRTAARQEEAARERLTVRAWRGEPLPLPAGPVRVTGRNVPLL
jgi:hypothetical protein